MVDAQRRTITSRGKRPFVDASLPVDFSKSTKLQRVFEELDGKTALVRGFLVRCTERGEDGTPRCSTSSRDTRLFIQPGSVREHRSSSSGDPRKDHSISFVSRGIAHSGVVAIGGETTGFTIELTSDGRHTWELDPGERFTDLCRQVSGRHVIVSGTVNVKKGVSIARRWIVSVRNLAPTAD
jgi:hypothetical protein